MLRQIFKPLRIVSDKSKVFLSNKNTSCFWLKTCIKWVEPHPLSFRQNLFFLYSLPAPLHVQTKLWVLTVKCKRPARPLWFIFLSKFPFHTLHNAFSHPEKSIDYSANFHTWWTTLKYHCDMLSKYTDLQTNIFPHNEMRTCWVQPAHLKRWATNTAKHGRRAVFFTGANRRWWIITRVGN